MLKIFISYARSDSKDAERIVEALHDSNVTGWGDIADIAAGDSVASAVRKAIVNSSAVLVLLSPRALHSEWVQFEIGAAEALKKNIIPIIVAGTDLELQVPDILKDRGWIDARGRSAADLRNEIERVLKRTG